MEIRTRLKLEWESSRSQWEIEGELGWKDRLELAGEGGWNPIEEIFPQHFCTSWGSSWVSHPSVKKCKKLHWDSLVPVFRAWKESHSNSFSTPFTLARSGVEGLKREEESRQQHNPFFTTEKGRKRKQSYLCCRSFCWSICTKMALIAPFPPTSSPFPRFPPRYWGKEEKQLPTPIAAMICYSLA